MNSLHFILTNLMSSVPYCNYIFKHLVSKNSFFFCIFSKINTKEFLDVRKILLIGDCELLSYNYYSSCICTCVKRPSHSWLNQNFDVVDHHIFSLHIQILRTGIKHLFVYYRNSKISCLPKSLTFFSIIIVL